MEGSLILPARWERNIASLYLSGVPAFFMHPQVVACMVCWAIRLVNTHVVAFVDSCSPLFLIRSPCPHTQHPSRPGYQLVNTRRVLCVALSLSLSLSPFSTTDPLSPPCYHMSLPTWLPAGEQAWSYVCCIRGQRGSCTLHYHCARWHFLLDYWSGGLRVSLPGCCHAPRA